MMLTIITKNKLIRFSSWILLAVLLQGCQDSRMGELKGFVENAYKDEKPEIEPLPEIQPYKGYEYAASEESDPFSTENIVTGNEAGVVGDVRRPDENRRREDLEKFPLDALRMVGTITRKNQPWVIVETSNGIAHLATIGNYLGQNDGKITRISPEKQLVVLAETVLDPGGRWVTRDVEIIVDE